MSQVTVKKSRFERLVSIIVLAILLASSYGMLYWSQNQSFPVLGEAASTKLFYISARQWEFYPRSIRVEEGDHVVMYLSTVDTTHGFYLGAFNQTVSMLEPNATAKIEFTADKVGRFEYYCTVYCGIGHTDMRGYIVVEPRRR